MGCERLPAEGHAGAASDFTFVGADADSAVYHKGAVTGPKQIVGDNAGCRETDGTRIVEAALARAHGEVLAGQE